MKTLTKIILFFSITILLFSIVFAHKQKEEGYILEHEKDIAQEQKGPHDGNGMTTAFSFFSKAKDLKLTFRKRILHPGSSIGYHLQKEDEIYYIASGIGEMKMNDKTFTVQAGDAILTRPGSSHGLQNTGKDDLTMIIAYENVER